MSNNVSLLSLLSGFYQVNKSILTRRCLFSLKRFKKIVLPSFKIKLLCSFHKTDMFRHLHNVGDRTSYWQSSHQCWSFSNREDNVQLLGVFFSNIFNFMYHTTYVAITKYDFLHFVVSKPISKFRKPSRYFTKYVLKMLMSLG